MNKNESFFTQDDEWFLWDNLLSSFKEPIVCAEVGNLTGTSTRFFSAAIPKGSTFYSIDKDNHDIDVPDTVIRIHKTSLAWEPPKLDFIYLDGDHNPAVVMQEIKKFAEVTNIIAGHDCGLVSYALLKQFGNKEVHTQFLVDNQCSSWIMRIL